METQNEIRRSTSKEEIAEWWRKVHAAFPASGERLMLAGYVGSKASIAKEFCEIWTTSSGNADAIRGIDTNQTHLANYHCVIHDEPISNAPKWEKKLSCGRVKYYIEKCGVTVLRAVLHSDLAEVAGYISGNVRTDPDTDKQYVHVNHVCVLTQHRHTGIGQMLWEAFLLYFEDQVENITEEIQLEVYLKNADARRWYTTIGFEDTSFTDLCRTMRLRCEEAPLAVALKDKPVAKACKYFLKMLEQVRPELDVLPWGNVVVKLEEQAQSLVQMSASEEASQLSPFYLKGVFTGAWQIRLNGSSSMWGRAFFGPLGIGFYDVKNPVTKQHDAHASSLQAIRVDGIGGSSAGSFKINHATLSKSDQGKLEWRWGKASRSEWKRDGGAKSPFLSTPPAPEATVMSEFQRAVDLLRTCVVAARRRLQPTGVTADEEVQMWLRTLLEPRVRLPLAKLQDTEAKLDRLERKYWGDSSLKRRESDVSEHEAEISKTGIKRFRSLPSNVARGTKEPLDV